MLIIGQSPHSSRPALASPGQRNSNVFLVIPQKHLAQRAKAFEITKDSPNGFLDFAIGRHFNAVRMAANKANRYDGQYLAPEHLLSIGFLSPLSEYTQLKFTHRALQSKQQSIVEQTRIVDSLRVHNECFGQHAQVDQMMPVAIIASKPRRFHGQYSPDSTITDRCQKSAEPGTLVVAGPGDAEILIDDYYFLESQLPSPVLQRILTTAAF